MTKHIYIVRHGETDYNRRGIVQGSGVDAELNEYGRLQAEAFFRYYRDFPFEVVLTSQLRRTHQTVQPFIEQGLAWEKWAELNEINWGIHEGKSGTPAMRQTYADLMAQWDNGNYEARIDQGESAAELASRLLRFTEALSSRSESRILICSHGRAIRALLTVLQQQELHRMNQYQHANTGLWKTRHEQGNFYLDIANDTTHLHLMLDQRSNHKDG